MARKSQPPADVVAAVDNVSIPPKPIQGVPREGEVLDGKYVVEGVLGTGGMGVVLAARHLTLDERFAVKVLLPELASNDEVVERFCREGRATIKLRSEHVVRVVDVHTLPSGLPYMVMEALDGWDLDRLLKERGRLAPEVAVDLLLQACEGIAEAHALGTVHRDLKPANLFLTHRADGSICIKVLDFGISKLVHQRGSHEITRTSAVMGSPEYMSPEQLRATREVDARADIWSLGAILHELVSGKPPFAGETIPEVCATVLKDEPPPLRRVRPDAPQGLEAIVLTCLEKDRERRFDDVGQLAFALAPFGTDEARASADRIARVLRASGIVSAGNTPSEAPLALMTRRKPRRGHAGLVAALGALALMVVGSVVVVRVGPHAIARRARATAARASAELGGLAATTAPPPPTAPAPPPTAPAPGAPRPPAPPPLPTTVPIPDPAPLPPSPSAPTTVLAPPAPPPAPPNAARQARPHHAPHRAPAASPTDLFEERK